MCPTPPVSDLPFKFIDRTEMAPEARHTLPLLPPNMLLRLINCMETLGSINSLPASCHLFN